MENENGFLTEFRPEHWAALMASAWTCYDLETTGLSTQAVPIAVGKAAKIGGTYTLTQYQKKFGVGIDCRVRARILSVSAENFTGSWDLDALSADDKKHLVNACLDGKIVIGANLGFDYAWSAMISDEWQPKMTLDVILLARILKPGLPWKVFERAAKGDPEATAYVNSAQQESASLEALSLACGLPRPDKSWQKPHNWAIKNLCRGHYYYVMSDVNYPVRVLKNIADCTESVSVLDTLEALKTLDAQRGGTYFSIYTHLPHKLARMHKRGMPLHVPTLEKIEAYRLAQLEPLTEALIECIPGMEAHKADLLSIKASATAGMKDTLSAYCEENGMELERSDSGSVTINSKRAKFVGATDLAGWKAWDSLQKAKKLLATVGEYRQVARPDSSAPGFSRIRPLVSATAITLRGRSQVPNSQNLPRPEHGLPDDLQFRSVIRARPGHVILSADYSQIELRIAAALSQRAVAEAKAIMAAGENSGYSKGLISALRLAATTQPILLSGLDDFNKDAAWVQECTITGTSVFDYYAELAATFRMVLRDGLPLSEVFKRNGDPHLLTAVRMAERTGKLDLAGFQALDWIEKQDAKVLKKDLADERQSAKPQNFGLLYGMQHKTLHSQGITEYGLTWSLDEAALARKAWLGFYPEIGFWHAWIKCAKKETNGRELKMRNKYTKALETKTKRLMADYTLSGRPVLGAAMRDCANYSDQGTGADMAWAAVINLPPEAESCLINMVHDELIFEVRDDQLDIAQKQAQETMEDAANALLAPYGIPGIAEPGHGPVWSK